jgi:hypothetical protein
MPIGCVSSKAPPTKSNVGIIGEGPQSFDWLQGPKIEMMYSIKSMTSLFNLLGLGSLMETGWFRKMSNW